MATRCNIHHKTVTYCNNLKQTASQAQESPDTPPRELETPTGELETPPRELELHPHRGIRDCL